MTSYRNALLPGALAVLYGLGSAAACNNTDPISGSGGSGNSAGSSRGGTSGRSGSDGGSGGIQERGGDGGRAGNAGDAVTSGGAGEPGTICGNTAGQLFPPKAPWNTPVENAPLAANSAATIAYLSAEHTASSRFQIDFSFKLLHADENTPRVPFTPSDDFYETECDPAAPPLPAGGSLEGETGYACLGDGDCHLLVIEKSSCRLYEMWRASVTSSQFSGGCQAIWDLNRVYPAAGRGEQCTSADAAGLPIAPLLFTADDVYAGKIAHAIRFILPNRNIRNGVYLHPATHSTRATSGPSAAPPYGARFRLKASADLSALSPAARVVARALQSYGMFLADAGNLTFTGLHDASSNHKWAEVGLTPQDLKPLRWEDFEVVASEAPVPYDGNCQRTPISSW